MKFNYRSRVLVLLTTAALLSSAGFILYNAHRNAVNSSFARFLPESAEKLAIPEIRNAGKS
jgi:hypothetical protein